MMYNNNLSLVILQYAESVPEGVIFDAAANWENAE